MYTFTVYGIVRKFANPIDGARWVANVKGVKVGKSVKFESKGAHK